MKETDYTLIQETAAKWLETMGCELVDDVGESIASLLVANIYMFYDVGKGFGQDLKDFGISVISSPNRISIITPEGMSFIQIGMPICEYIDLTDDIHQIVMMIQAVYERIMSRQ